MKSNSILAIAACCIVLYSCKPQSEATNSNTSSDNTGNETVPATVNINTNTNNNQTEPTKPTGFDKEISLTQNMTNFSFDFYKFLSEEKIGKNMCFSPVSMNIALAMVYEGARNNTFEEMSQTLYFTDSLDVFSTDFGNYLKNIESLSKDSAVEFNLANRVFIEKTYAVLESYRNIIKTTFSGAFEQMDFVNHFSDAEAYINKWVEKMTKQRIKDLLPAGTLGPDTRMVLVNAIYIKSRWKYTFDEKATIPKDFMISETDIMKTDFMIKKQKGIRYYNDHELSAIELPYTSQGVSLIIIRPHKSTAQNISSFIPTGSKYIDIIDGMKYREVYMEIPKFKIETSFSLSDPLVAKGMTDAFSSRADFSGITGDTDLSISEVLQKVFFEMDEKGSEAAAATAVVMRATSVAPNHEMEEIMYFIANQPFIFILKENFNNTPLFIGQFVRPN